MDKRCESFRDFFTFKRNELNFKLLRLRILVKEVLTEKSSLFSPENNQGLKKKQITSGDQH